MILKFIHAFSIVANTSREICKLFTSYIYQYVLFCFAEDPWQKMSAYNTNQPAGASPSTQHASFQQHRPRLKTNGVIHNKSPSDKPELSVKPVGVRSGIRSGSKQSIDSSSTEGSNDIPGHQGTLDSHLSSQIVHENSMKQEKSGKAN